MCRTHWVADIGDIDGDQWDMALELIPVVSISASQTFAAVHPPIEFTAYPIDCLTGVTEIHHSALNVMCLEVILSS